MTELRKQFEKLGTTPNGKKWISAKTGQGYYLNESVTRQTDPVSLRKRQSNSVSSTSIESEKLETTKEWSTSKRRKGGGLKPDNL